MNKSRGIALLWVLWILVIGSSVLALAMQLSMGSYATAAFFRQHSQNKALTEIGLQTAMAHLALPMGDANAWWPDNRVHEWTSGRSTLRVWISDEASKLDVNATSAPDLQSYFIARDEPEAQAQRLAEAIVAYRETRSQETSLASQGAHLEQSQGLQNWVESIQQLQAIPGFDPARYIKYAPDLTVYSGRTRPDTRWASAKVQQVFGTSAAQGLQHSGWFRIETEVLTPKQARITATYIVQRAPLDEAGHAYRVVSWHWGIGRVVQ